MSTPKERRLRGWSGQKTILPKKRTIGWPRCYNCQNKHKRGWWETIRQLLF